MSSSCCLAVGLALHELTLNPLLNPLVATAEVNEVESLARRACRAFELDAYALSAAVMFAQRLLAPGSGFDWRSALTAGICLSFKLLCDERVFASDASSFVSSFTSEQLIDLEARAFAVWLPKIANVHVLAFHFRTALLDLAMDHSSASTPALKKVTILIVEENVAPPSRFAR